MMRRPQDTEAASYYFTYINQVPGNDPLDAMEKQLDEGMTLFSTISEDTSLHRYAPEKWSIRELLSHVTDTERAFAFRTLWFARGFSDSLPSFDQNVAAASAEANRVSWISHVEEFRVVRLSTIALLRNMPVQAWENSGIASGNRFTVRALAYIIPGHVAHHVGVLRERYLAKA